MKAKYIFDEFPGMNYITKDSFSTEFICLWSHKPTPRIRGNWSDGGVGDSEFVIGLKLDEFKGKPWKECIIEREGELK